MATILGLGCSHAPFLLRPPETWAAARQSLYQRVPDYDPPPQLIRELGEDNGLSQDIVDQQNVIRSFDVLRGRLHEFSPNVLLLIGDDQAENFLEDNLPPFCIYTGPEIEAYPFRHPRAGNNLWNAGPDTKFTFRCPQDFSKSLRNSLIREGFDIASSNALKVAECGLGHAHINPLVFLDPEGKFLLLPIFVNCLGEEAGPDYPPKPTPKRCYELGQGIRQFLDTQPEKVAVIASASWSHSFLTHKFQRRAIDLETDRKYLEWVKTGEGQRFANVSPEDLQASGDHEILNWIIALGILGDQPAEIVDVRESHTQLSFRVAALWE